MASERLEAAGRFEYNFPLGRNWKPKTPANFLKQQVKNRFLTRRAQVMKAARNEIRRQEHINSKAAESARQFLNAEDNGAYVNNDEINSRNASFEPEITYLQSQIYALESANPVNSVELERIRAMLEVAQTKQMLELIEKTIPEYIERYGEDNEIVQDMYITQREALERLDVAIARLQTLEAARGGRRRSTRRRSKKTRRN
jgi:hypothetical protein